MTQSATIPGAVRAILPDGQRQHFQHGLGAMSFGRKVRSLNQNKLIMLHRKLHMCFQSGNFISSGFVQTSFANT